MKLPFAHSKSRNFAGAFSVACALALIFPALAAAQSQSSAVTTSTDIQQTELHQLTDLQRNSKVNPRERDAYKAFFQVSPQEADKKIQLGNAFLQKYPHSFYAEAVDVGLTNAYYAKQDWKDFYVAADDALALKPDEVDVLTNVGWVIPHVYDTNDADADQQLSKAESYEKRAIAALATMPKPKGLSKAQFSALKTQKSQEAHSALGLIYFRRKDYGDSEKELDQAVQDNTSPDQTDLYVLGADLQNLQRSREAAGLFDRCAQISGALQDSCKQLAESARKQAAQAK